MLLDPVILSRIQFAFTIGFHIFFPTLTIGLSLYLVYMEWKWLRTQSLVYLQQYKFWIQVFALAFGIGVVSGVVMAYQFGTNFSSFIVKTGNVIGPLLSFEVLSAFFLEAGFLGIMLFGWNKVGPKLHFFATLMVSVGTLISAFWILSANSWMQTPQGHTIDENGIFFAENWLQIIFNPSFSYRYVHMILASIITASFVMAGIAGFYLLKNIHPRFSRNSLSMILWVVLIAVPVQIFLGDAHGLNTKEHQPMKIAAIEAIWETEMGADLVLFGIPDQQNKKTDYKISIEKGASLLLTHELDGEVEGLNMIPQKDWPPVAPVFFSFRIMVGIGVIFLVMALWGTWLRIRGRLFENKFYHFLLVCVSPLGFVATIAGWCVTEMGRQPYVVYGLVRTADSISPVSGEKVLISLSLFIIVYTALFIAFLIYMFKTIGKGPDLMEDTQFQYPKTSFGHIIKG